MKIKLAMELKKNIRFFSLGKKIDDIKEINIDDIYFEEEVKNEINTDDFITELKGYLSV